MPDADPGTPTGWAVARGLLDLDSWKDAKRVSEEKIYRMPDEPPAGTVVRPVKPHVNGDRFPRDWKRDAYLASSPFRWLPVANTGPLAVNSSWREILGMYRDGVVIVKSNPYPTPWGIRWTEIRGNADGTFDSSLVIEDANGKAMFDMSAIGQQRDELWQVAVGIVNTMNNKEES